MSRNGSVKNVFGVAAALSLCLWPPGVTFADTVWVEKICPSGSLCTSGNPYAVRGNSKPQGKPPCPLSFSTTGTASCGYFRVTMDKFNWTADYRGTSMESKEFWLSDTGPNVADRQLGTTGTPSGVETMANGVHYISINTFFMGPGYYTVFGPGVFGDPHITTTNGINYDFQGAGEFVMLKDLGKYEVQTRMTPVATTGAIPANPHTGLSTCVSINTAAAVRAGTQRVTYQPNISGEPDPRGLQLRVDGAVVEGRVDGKTLNDGTKIWRDSQSGELRIEHADYTGVKITPHWWDSQKLWYLDVDMTPPPATVGIAGDVPPRGWLPALADGSSIGPRPADLHDRYEALYVRFADSWRVSDSSTLFDYAPGTSTKTYTMRTWPGESGKCELPSTVPVRGVSSKVAEETCQAIRAPRFKEFCVFDVMVTGNRGFGESYAVAEGLPKTEDKGCCIGRFLRRVLFRR